MKKIEKRVSSVEKRIGSISLESERLIGILEKINSDRKISADSNGYHFSEIADIKDNIATFSGNPIIKIGDTTVEFE